MPLVINHLAAAIRAFDQGRLGIAILLAYATLKRYIDLCLSTLYQLVDEDPDYTKIIPKLDMDKYHEKGRLLFDKKKYKERELSGPIMLGNGIQLLATLEPERIPDNLLGPLRGLMTARNKCPYEHGLKTKPLTQEEVHNSLKLVTQILARHISKEELEKELELYKFPEIPDLM